MTGGKHLSAVQEQLQRQGSMRRDLSQKVSARGLVHTVNGPLAEQKVPGLLQPLSQQHWAPVAMQILPGHDSKAHTDVLLQDALSRSISTGPRQL